MANLFGDGFKCFGLLNKHVNCSDEQFNARILCDPSKNYTITERYSFKMYQQGYKSCHQSSSNQMKV